MGNGQSAEAVPQKITKKLSYNAFRSENLMSAEIRSTCTHQDQIKCKERTVISTEEQEGGLPSAPPIEGIKG